MTEKSGTGSQNAFETDWIKTMTDLWSPVMETWAKGMPTASTSAEQPEDGANDPFHGFVQMWQTLVQQAGNTAAMDHMNEASKVVPDMLMGFAQICLRGFVRFQNQVNLWMENKKGDIFTQDTASFNQMFLNGWTEVYEKELRQFLKLPQIGLGRVYQERVLHAADRYNLFQTAYTKFIHQLYLPLEEAFNKLQDQVAQDAKKEQVQEDPKVYYYEWVKILEGCYMKLFKQPEFSLILGQTLSALNEYSAAKQAVVNDMLKQNAIPTQEDLDELYKEIYLIKKRMRLYEKQ